MPTFNAAQRLIRRSKFARGLALVHAKKLRAKQRHARWDYERSVLSGVATFIFTWAGIERQLNSLICAYHPYAAENLRKRGLPSNISEKIDYLVAVGKDERIPATFRTKISEWVPKLGRLRDHRHLLVHGMIFQRNRKSTDWYAHELKMVEGWPTVTETKLSNEVLNAKLRDGSELAADMAKHLNPIFFGPDWHLG